ncbi:hypothetical protein GO986_08975 [Deinococcus sp. HMF7620]|uniref:Terminase small subunit n=1 Tax=Deinococcus arboris TaxID=2682977 RepID=A0A7C9LN60_9DEIO|nr:hypothetical protein [Deinococcus arboris]MVN86896.1 hypothetical protein [Deinococcus arboris]
MPRGDKKAKPSTKKPDKKAGGSGGAKPQRARPHYDWTAIRREYIRGGDEVTLKALSDKPGAPTHDALKARSSREDWAELRAEFRHQVATRMQQLDLDTVEEVRARHSQLGRRMQELAESGMDYLDLSDLGAFGVARLATAGAQLERQARGMEEYTVRIEDLRSPADVKKLPKEQLLELIERRRKARGAQA